MLAGWTSTTSAPTCRSGRPAGSVRAATAPTGRRRPRCPAAGRRRCGRPWYRANFDAKRRFRSIIVSGGSAAPEEGRVAIDVLIAEDEPSILESLDFILTRAGLSIAAVTDGEAALAAVRRLKPRLLVLDVMLPRRSGFD